MATTVVQYRVKPERAEENQRLIGAVFAEMERNLSEVLSARVSVKATTNEGMGFIGRGEGLACRACRA